MPRRISVWRVAIRTLTPLGMGIIIASEAQGPAAASLPGLEGYSIPNLRRNHQTNLREVDLSRHSKLPVEVPNWRRLGRVQLTAFQRIGDVERRTQAKVGGVAC
jgi:hypothetical protein